MAIVTAAPGNRFAPFCQLAPPTREASRTGGSGVSHHIVSLNVPFKHATVLTGVSGFHYSSLLANSNGIRELGIPSLNTETLARHTHASKRRGRNMGRFPIDALRFAFLLR